MENNGKFKLNGKEYQCEVKDGVRYVDGIRAEEFMKTLDFASLLQFAVIGKQKEKDDKAGVKGIKYQTILDSFHQAKNN